MKSIIAILIFFLGIALIFWAAKPLWDKIAVLRVERNGIAGTLSELRSLESARDNLLATYNSISKSDLEKLDQILPQNTDTGGVLVAMEKITQDRGVRLRRAEFKTGQDNNLKVVQASNSMFNTLDLSVVVSSSYDSFKSLLNAIEKSSRVIDVSNISFSVGQTNLYEFIVQADAYYGKGPSQVANLRDISGITIDTSFFSDPRFLELELIPAPSVEAKKGRTNPFAPI